MMELILMLQCRAMDYKASFSAILNIDCFFHRMVISKWTNVELYAIYKPVHGEKENYMHSFSFGKYVPNTPFYHHVNSFEYHHAFIRIMWLTYLHIIVLHKMNPKDCIGALYMEIIDEVWECWMFGWFYGADIFRINIIVSVWPVSTYLNLKITSN